MSELSQHLGKRRTCTRCRRRRVIKVVWGNSGPFLCQPCAAIPGAVTRFVNQLQRLGGAS